MSRGRARRGLAAAAAGIAVLTSLARLAGFARVFVFNSTVGAGCTGAAYAAANQLPNVLFEVAAGGALAGAVVPVLSGLLATGRRQDADRVASALLTWVVVVLTPLAVLLAAVSGPVSRLLLAGSATAGDCGDGAALVALTARMILIFAPQIVLYGVGVVLTGVLQARHRFTGPALAPLLSSLVVIGAYLLFGAAGGGPGGDPARLPGRGPELVLSIGTTLGVAALSLPLLLPAARAGGRLRPALRLPPGAARALRGPALAGLVALLAQQGAVVVTVVLTSRAGGAGALNAVQYVQAVYLLPYAVLGVPVATAAFPRLAEHAAAGRRADFAETAARGTRWILLLSLLGSAVLVAAAPAVQALFQVLDVAGGGALGSLAESLGWYAAGLTGWALVAQLTRVLYALGRSRPVAAATATGWAVAAAGSVALTLTLRGLGVPGLRATLVALGAATSAGMLLAAGLLLRGVARAAGHPALAGVRRAAVTGVTGAVAGGSAGWLVACALVPGGAGQGDAGTVLLTGVLAAVVAAVAFGLVCWLRQPGAAPPGITRPPGVAAWPRVLLVLATSGGGTGAHVAGLAGWLRRAGVAVRVAAPAGAGAAFGLAATGADVAVVELARRPRPRADARALRQLWHLAGDADVVHAHGVRAGALAVLAARSRPGRPGVVVTVHNAPPVPWGGGLAPDRPAGVAAVRGALRDAAARAVHGLLARVVARGADRVLVVSGDLGDRMRALGARHVERALVPAPQRAPARDPAAARAALGLGEGAWLVVTVARLAPQKGLGVLLDALALLRDRPLRAVIAGDGPLQAGLAARITRDVLPVALLGRRDDVAELLAAADVVVVPSLWEGQPLIVQEALRAGAAIIATDTGGVPEVAGDGALLVPPGDPPALAAALAGLFGDPARVVALRRGAALRAEQLPSDQDAGSQVLTIYRDLCGAGPAPLAGEAAPPGRGGGPAGPSGN
jgi:putative peptidoglycan lipid II flippase